MDLIKPFEIDLCAKKDTGNIGTWKFGTDDTKSESNSGDECGKGSIFFFLWYRQKRKPSRLQKVTKLGISRQLSEVQVSSFAWEEHFEVADHNVIRKEIKGFRKKMKGIPHLDCNNGK